jgi:hypothetical protein
MLTIGDSVRSGGRLARRPFLRVGGTGLAGLAGLSALLGRSPGGLAAAPPNEPAARFLRDRSVVFLFMHGGPSQFETFDPKTEGPSNVHAQTGAIATSIPGISFGSTFVQLAKRAHLLNIVRSFVTGDGNHDIKPVVGRATSGANIGSLYARVAGANRPARNYWPNSPNRIRIFNTLWNGPTARPKRSSRAKSRTTYCAASMPGTWIYRRPSPAAGRI